jgi:hypothetical protein
VFPEFDGRSLFALIWELQRSVPSAESSELTIPLQESRTVENALSWMAMVEPVGEEDSTWRMDAAKLKDFAAAESKLRISRWK